MCTLQLPHPLVSRQHCEIFVEAGKLKVRDLGSLNGTFVNGQKCTVTSLPAGSMLVVGTVTFRVVYDTTEAAGAPPSAPKTVPQAIPLAGLPQPDSSELEPLADFAPGASRAAPPAPATPALPTPASPPEVAAKGNALSEEFEVRIAPNEDFVEVVEDVTDMMPPSADYDASGTAIARGPLPNAAPPPPISGSPNSDDDLDTFLKSLGNKK